MGDRQRTHSFHSNLDFPSLKSEIWGLTLLYETFHLLHQLGNISSDGPLVISFQKPGVYRFSGTLDIFFVPFHTCVTLLVTL